MVSQIELLLRENKLMIKLLMCRPTYYDVEYNINHWMTGNQKKVNVEKAQTQWKHLYNSLREVADVNLIIPQPNLPDMVFTANAGFYTPRHNMVYMSNFINEERKGEEIHFMNWFKNNGYSIHYPTNHFEGEGDLLKGDMGQYWIGHGFRSSKKLHNKFPFDELPTLRKLHLVDARFYHLDTCFAPLKENGVLWYPGAFDIESQTKIRKFTSRQNSIEVTEEEALTFACNAVIIKNNVFMPECDSIADKLTKFGYKVQTFCMSEFIKSGGACKCLVMKIGKRDD